MSYTKQHRTVLIIFILNLQTNIIALTVSIGGREVKLRGIYSRLNLKLEKSQ